MKKAVLKTTLESFGFKTLNGKSFVRGSITGSEEVIVGQSVVYVRRDPYQRIISSRQCLSKNMALTDGTLDISGVILRAEVELIREVLL